MTKRAYDKMAEGLTEALAMVERGDLEKPIVPPPGFYIAEEMEARGITLADFAHYLDIDVGSAAKLLAGRVRVDLALARNIGGLFGVAPEFLLNLQRAYDDQ